MSLARTYHTLLIYGGGKTNTSLPTPRKQPPRCRRMQKGRGGLPPKVASPCQPLLQLAPFVLTASPAAPGYLATGWDQSLSRVAPSTCQPASTPHRSPQGCRGCADNRDVCEGQPGTRWPWGGGGGGCTRKDLRLLSKAWRIMYTTFPGVYGPGCRQHQKVSEIRGILRRCRKNVFRENRRAKMRVSGEDSRERPPQLHSVEERRENRASLGALSEPACLCPTTCPLIHLPRDRRDA